MGCGDEVHKEIELAPRYVGKADAADAGTTLVNAEAHRLPGRLGPDVRRYLFAGQLRGGSGRLWPTTARRRGQRHQLMLTRYHAGKADEVESDVASYRPLRRGELQNTRATARPCAWAAPLPTAPSLRAEGGLEIAGTRTSVGDVDGEEHGGRIVVASEGVTEGENKTKLGEHERLCSGVSTEQLVRPDAPLYGGGLRLADGGHGDGCGGFPFLTATAALGSGTGAAAQGCPGRRHGHGAPTLQSISGVLWNDENNNGIQT